MPAPAGSELREADDAWPTAVHHSASSWSSGRLGSAARRQPKGKTRRQLAPGTEALDVPDVPAFQIPPPSPVTAAPLPAGRRVPAREQAHLEPPPTASSCPVNWRGSSPGPTATDSAVDSPVERLLAAALQKTSEALGNVVRCRMDDMQEALEKALERLLGEALAKALEASGLRALPQRDRGVNVSERDRTVSISEHASNDSAGEDGLHESTGRKTAASKSVMSVRSIRESQSLRPSQYFEVSHSFGEEAVVVAWGSQDAGEPPALVSRPGGQQAGSPTHDAWEQQLDGGSGGAPGPEGLLAMSTKRVSGSTDSSISAEMWPVWCNPLSQENSCESDGAPQRPSRPSTNGKEVEMEVSDFNTRGSLVNSQGVARNEGTVLNRFMLHPGSRFLIAWVSVGPMFLLYDMVTVPLQAFQLPLDWSLLAMDKFIACYWLFDLMRSFVTGYEADKWIEMRFSMTAHRYARSWFPLDLMCCTLDWVFVIAGEDLMAPSMHINTRRVFRAAKMLRLLRLLKFGVKVWELMDTLSYQAMIKVRTMIVFLTVCFLCHVLACYWYFVGHVASVSDLTAVETSPGPHPPYRGWLQEYHLEDATFSELYVVSFHWAMGQSGFAHSSICPTNTLERIYASCASLLWLIFVSVTASLVFMWLARLRATNLQQEQQGIDLRRYLAQRGVSRALAHKVLYRFQKSWKEREKRLHEADVEFLRDLPLALKVRLHKEVYLPVLRSHPFFQLLGEHHDSLLVMTSHLAMQEHYYLPGETVFQEGTAATEMLYVLAGSLEYIAVYMGMWSTRLCAGDWACEPALWLRWDLKGRLLTVLASELVGVNVEKFQAIMQASGDMMGENRMPTSEGRTSALSSASWWTCASTSSESAPTRTCGGTRRR